MGQTLVRQAVDTLASPQSSYSQKQAAWKQLRESGKLDQALRDLEQPMADDTRTPEFPALLGQAYLQKCATLQDVREQRILAMKAHTSRSSTAAEGAIGNRESRIWTERDSSFAFPCTGQSSPNLEY